MPTSPPMPCVCARAVCNRGASELHAAIATQQDPGKAGAVQGGIGARCSMEGVVIVYDAATRSGGGLEASRACPQQGLLAHSEPVCSAALRAPFLIRVVYNEKYDLESAPGSCLALYTYYPRRCPGERPGNVCGGPLAGCQCKTRLGLVGSLPLRHGIYF